MLKIGNNIRNIRRRQGFTQEALASLLHLTPQAISSWEIDRTLPDAERLAELAKVLDCSADEILGLNKK